MGSGFDITVATLALTRNDAAVPVLVAGLTASQRDIQEGSFRALLERRNAAAQVELVRRWHVFSDRWRGQIAENPSRMAAAVRSAIAAAEFETFANACQVAIATRDFDLIPVLAVLVGNTDDSRTQTAVQTILELAELLHDELAAPRDYRERRDPQLMRQHCTGSLESALVRFDQHRRTEMIEAFLLLTKSDNPALRKALDDPQHVAHAELRDVLRNSPRPGVMRLILKYLERPSAPASVLQVLSERRDVPFLRRMAKSLGNELNETVRRNVRRIEHFSWFDELPLLNTLNEHEQGMAMELAAASGAVRDDVFAVVRFLLRAGNAGGRRAAAKALAEFRGFEANDLAMTALDDPDPLVQAAVIPQLRERSMPGAMARIIALVDSDHPEVRVCAQNSLAEFSFQRYLAAFDMLDADVRRTTGALVRKIDPLIVPQLREELCSQSRLRKIRGLQIAPAVGLVSDLEDAIIALLTDDDPYIRAEAARSLSTIRSIAAEEALKAAQSDSSAEVKQAAECAIATMLSPPPDSWFAAPDSAADLHATEG